MDVGEVKVSPRNNKSDFEITSKTVLLFARVAMIIPTMQSHARFFFEKPLNGTASHSLTFRWKSSSRDVTLVTLSIRRQNMGDSDGDGQDNRILDSVHILAANVRSDAGEYIWQFIDVQEGWYTIHAIEESPVAGLIAESSPFYVARRVSPAFAHRTYRPKVTPSLWRLQDSAELAGVGCGVVVGLSLLLMAFISPRCWRRALPSRKKKRRYILY